MATFIQNWDAKRGDIIYGMDEDRRNYLKRLPGGSTGSWKIMDEFNNALLPGKNQFGSEKFPKTPNLLELAENKTKLAKNPLAETYFQYQKTATKSALNIDQLAKKYDGKEQPGVDPRYSNMIRRACKHGIEFVLREDGISHLHFVLDKIAEDGYLKVKDKIVEHGYTAYTYSELRYIFKNWAKLSATKRIHFYINLEEVPPPWEVAEWKLKNSANPAKKGLV